MKKRMRGLKYIFLLCAALISAVLCIVLPKRVIDYEKNKFMEVSLDMPEEYYPTSSYYEVTKEFSAKLSEYQKRQLISGVWKSDISPVDEEYYEEIPYHVQENAKAAINRFNDKGFYPMTVESSYQFWYTWDCTYFQALDTNFKTYAGFFWKAHFIRFNGADSITLYMTPEGRSIKAIYAADEMPSERKSFSVTKTKELAQMMLGSGFEVTDAAAGAEKDKEMVLEYLETDPLTEDLGIESAEIEKEEPATAENQAQIEEQNANADKALDEEILVNLVTVKDKTVSTNTSETHYYVYVYQSSERYVFGLIPVE